MDTSPDIPQTPLSQQVAYISSDYTIQPDGTWKPDSEHTHFQYDGGNYYVRTGESINKRSNWFPDTMTGQHRSTSEYEAHLANQNQEEANQIQADYNQKTLEQAQQQLNLQRQAYETEQARIAQELAEIQAERQAEIDAENERLRRKQKGRKATILTGGSGLSGDAPTKRKTLLGA
jgi:hypothetical protein